MRSELRCIDLGRIITIPGEVNVPLRGYGLRFEVLRDRIRWVIVDPCERGQGLGKRLLGESIEYCQARLTM